MTKKHPINIPNPINFCFTFAHETIAQSFHIQHNTIMAFLETLREGRIKDLDFVNDDFQEKLIKAYDDDSELQIAGRALQAEADALGVNIEPIAQAVITFGNLTKKQYRQLSAAERQELKDSFAALVPEGSPAEKKVESFYNLYVDSRASTADMVDLGNELFATDPDEGGDDGETFSR